MARRRERYLCTTCEVEAPQWTGRCASCGEWNSLIVMLRPRVAADALDVGAVVALSEVHQFDGGRLLRTNLDELDRVLGGGITSGSATLLFGPPGIGKSTLLMQVLASVASTGTEVLLASAEESLGQVMGRAQRLGPIPPTFRAIEGFDVGAVEAAIEHCRPALAVVDSIQSIADAQLAKPCGSLAQVRSCVERLTRLAKVSAVPVVLVGHVTKEGDLAGPRAIEHLVDTVLSFDGDRHHALRVLTSVKHRFGPAGEVGLFEMRDDGLRVVPDPGPLMLGDRVIGIPGSVVAPILQGRRPLLVEVQALIGKTEAAKRPRAQGLDAARAGVLAAVLTSRAGVSFEKGELFVAAAGGVSVAEPAADLAVAVAMASAQRGTLVPPEIVVFGEIGLAGEVRTVPGTDRRLAEAWRCGFLGAVVPASTPDDAVPDGMRVCRVRNVADALEAASESQTGTMPSWLTATASRSTTRWP